MSKNIRESEVKNRIRQEYFSDYNWTRAVGDIDLTVCSNTVIGNPETFLWAETKAGTRRDIYESLIQLILTVGKARTFESELPPFFLGAADAEKIAFVEYNKVMHIFSKTDFNWNVTPSDHSTKEFKELYGLLHDELQKDVVIFKFAYDDVTLRKWIKKNFKEGREFAAKISVGKNNFTYVYYDWVKSVKESIAVDWKQLAKVGVLDCDFFLADLMSKDGMSIKDKLKVVLEKTKYKVLVKAEFGGIFDEAFKEFSFKDEQKAYIQFWNRYERPPKPIYQRFILDRRDLLVPQDIREIKGSYYTPEQWVRLSQEYLAKALGEDWQEEYYIWDCAAGSGNLLRGLTNKYNIYASTLDDSDVKVMHDAIDGGRLNLLKNNVFQFDFLNDGYVEKDGQVISDLENCEKIPESLRKIISDPEKRKKLVVYQNCPYAEHGNRKVIGDSEDKKHKTDVAKSKVYHQFKPLVGTGVRELYMQFLLRELSDLRNCKIATFSTLKYVCTQNASRFREYFKAAFKTGFICESSTFDNVTGHFPIGFLIWDTSSQEVVKDVTLDIAETDNEKTFRSCSDIKMISDWLRTQYDKTGSIVAYVALPGVSIEQNGGVYFTNKPTESDVAQHKVALVTPNNLLAMSVYVGGRKSVQDTWITHNDDFRAPKDSWAGDIVFQTDCLVWSIFNNAVKEENGICHWIPFYEDEVNSCAPFNSRFMADFLHGKIERQKVEVLGGLFEQQEAEEVAKTVPFDALSDEAKAVLDAGKEIWKYYMSKPGVSVNASFLDIRAYFQGFKTTEKGKRMMNSTSEDARYTELLADFRAKMKALEAHIEPKIYEHGFLLR